MRWYQGILIITCSLLFSSCTKKTHSETQKKQTPAGIITHAQSSSAPSFEVTRFRSATKALNDVIRLTKPSIIGFGEFHQSKNDTGVRSAIARFSQNLLPTLAPHASDLVVETWQPLGCGKTEEKAVAEIKEVIERPKQTESEVVQLIKKAKTLDVQPHILKVTCNDYEQLFNNDAGTMDLYEMLVLVGRLLKEKAEEIYHYRNKEKQKAKPAPKRVEKMILIYGGAVHNDPHPDAGWDEVAFGPNIFKATKGKYLEIDLYVPEFIEKNPMMKEEKWYPLFEKHASTEKVVVIKRNNDAYTLIFKRGVTNSVSTLSTHKASGTRKVQ